MTQPAAEIIDQIVREVLARLGTTAESPAASPAAAELEPRRAEPEPAAQNGELAVGGGVVSLAAVEDRLQGVRRLVVPPGAVVTPSVRDELRRRKIALVQGRPAVPGANGGLRVFMTVLGSRFDPAPLQSALAAEGMGVSIERTDCLVAATDAVARQLDEPQTVALVISTYPAVALALANRHAAVRAAWGIDPGRMADDTASLGANVLVLDPRSTGPFQLKQMAVQFCRRGPLECPEPLEERLGQAGPA